MPDMVPYGDNFTIVLPMEDDLLHIADKPFCWDSVCGCHRDETLFREVQQFVLNGEMTPMKRCSSSQERRCEMQNRQYHPIPRRATAEYLPTHRAGHSSGIHPEDEPYLTSQRRRYPANPFDLADDLDYPDESTRRPTSARRWTTTEGQQVIHQGNRQIIIHEGDDRTGW